MIREKIEGIRTAWYQARMPGCFERDYHNDEYELSWRLLEMDRYQLPITRKERRETSEKRERGEREEKRDERSQV